MRDLVTIAARYDTDKAVHTHYLRDYEKYFSRLRDQDVRLLELGILEGGSLLLWRDYFQKGLIVGLDINPVQLDDPTGRVRVYQGAQQDTEVLDKIAAENAPDGFDVIIDDCSHIGALTRASFWHLFDNHLKSGGMYIIEDWGTGYWDTWIDGIRYRPRAQGFSPPLHRLTRINARLQAAARNVPFAGRVLSMIKAAMIRSQHRSHDYGMVGFVKELIDELGMADITHAKMGVRPHRESKFRELRIAPGHVLVVKR